MSRGGRRLLWVRSSESSALECEKDNSASEAPKEFRTALAGMDGHCSTLVIQGAGRRQKGTKVSAACREVGRLWGLGSRLVGHTSWRA